MATLNRRHFVRLHAEASSHAGVIACTFDPDFAAALRLAKRLHTSAELWLGLQNDWDLWHAAQALPKA